jgi:hypothetical protein
VKVRVELFDCLTVLLRSRIVICFGPQPLFGWAEEIATVVPLKSSPNYRSKQRKCIGRLDEQ